MVHDGPGELGARRHLVVSERLRQRRRELGLTQRDVTTRLAALGVRSTNKSLSSLERGSGLDVGKLPELAFALDCSVTWLLGLTDDPHRWEPTEPVPAESLPAESLPAGPLPAEPLEPAPGAGAHRPWILGPLDQATPEPAPLPAIGPITAVRTR